MIIYLCIDRFIEILKESFPKLTKMIICFDPRKRVEKTKYNKLQLHPYGLVLELKNEKIKLNISF
jgi:hypothetical protein